MLTSVPPAELGGVRSVQRRYPVFSKGGPLALDNTLGFPNQLLSLPFTSLYLYTPQTCDGWLKGHVRAARQP